MNRYIKPARASVGRRRHNTIKIDNTDKCVPGVSGSKTVDIGRCGYFCVQKQKISLSENDSKYNGVLLFSTFTASFVSCNVFKEHRNWVKLAPCWRSEEMDKKTVGCTFYLTNTQQKHTFNTARFPVLHAPYAVVGARGSGYDDKELHVRAYACMHVRTCQGQHVRYVSYVPVSCVL